MPKELRPGNANSRQTANDVEIFSPFVDEVGVETNIQINVSPNRVLYSVGLGWEQRGWSMLSCCTFAE